jgi:hypothetical protein
MKSLNKLAVSFALLPALASAEPLPQPVTDMDCLVGAWKGAGSLTMGKDKAAIAVTWDCKRTSAQFGVLCQARMTGIPGVAVYDETDLFGYEPNSKLYHWYSVTNAGETHDHVAKPPTGDSVQFVFNGVQEGKPFREVIDMTFSKDGKGVAAKVETFSGGASTSRLDLSLRK